MRDVCDGLVIREMPYGENDRLITVLTADEGQIMFTAKGARSPRSKTMPLCRLFVYANFEYYEKNGRRWLSGGSVNEGFYGISDDIQGFSLASYIVQLAAEISGEGVPADEVLRMTLNTLYAIEKKIKPYDQIKSVYEIFAACESGFTPALDACRSCGTVDAESWWLDVMNGSICCAKCLSEKSAGAPIPEFDRLMTHNIFAPLDRASLAAWRYVSACEPKKVLSFEIKDAESMRLLSSATEKYLTNHLERGFDTLDFYHAVKE